jgi:hypothetical protein
MSSNGVPIQDISDTVGHKSTHVTETVYRHVIVPQSAGERPSWTMSSASQMKKTRTCQVRVPGRQSGSGSRATVVPGGRG